MARSIFARSSFFVAPALLWAVANGCSADSAEGGSQAGAAGTAVAAGASGSGGAGKNGGGGAPTNQNGGAGAGATGAMGAGGGAAQGAGGGAGAPPDAMPSFRRDIIPLFARSCGSGDGGCHAENAYAADPNSACRGWLSLVDDELGQHCPNYCPPPCETPCGNPNVPNPTGCPDRSLYERLTELDAWLCQTPRRYVVPGDPDESHVFNVITGASLCEKSPGVPANLMPPTGPLGAPDVDLVRRWIASGAPDN